MEIKENKEYKDDNGYVYFYQDLDSSFVNYRFSVVKINKKKVSHYSLRDKEYAGNEIENLVKSSKFKQVPWKLAVKTLELESQSLIEQLIKSEVELNKNKYITYYELEREYEKWKEKESLSI